MDNKFIEEYGYTLPEEEALSKLSIEDILKKIEANVEKSAKLIKDIEEIREQIAGKGMSVVMHKGTF